MSDFVIPSSGHQTLSGLLMATPATLTASALTVPPGAFERILVGAEPKERRLTELAVGGPLRVHELGDELRPHPGRVLHARRWIEGRLLRAQPLEFHREHVERFPREAGPYFADVAKLRSVIQADEERAKMLAAPFRRGVSADHELGLLAHFHLAPERGPNSGLIWGALVLCEDPFPTETLRFAVGGLSVADEPSRYEEGNGRASEKPLERRAALAERSRHQRSAVLLEQVEDRVLRGRGAGGAAPLQ